MYKTKILFFIISFCLIGILTSLKPIHALYVSVIQIHTPVDGEAEIIVKVFSDDLQNVIRNYSKNYQPTPLESFFEPNRPLIEEYFTENLSIKINTDLLSLELTKYEKENDALFIHFTSKSAITWKNVEVKAPYFMELFPDQSNIISIDYEGEKYHGRLTASSRSFIQTL